MWYVRLSQIGSSMSKYGATNAPSASTPAGCTNPAEAARTTVFGRSAVSTSEAQARRLDASSGRAAFACAANSPPFEVLSAASAASMSAAVTSPPAASETSSAHDRSASISRPSRTVSPVRSARTCSHCAGVAAALAKPVTNCSWLSLPASAACASAQRPSATFSRVAVRFSGATYASAASCSWPSVVRTVVDSVSAPMLRSTRST